VRLGTPAVAALAALTLPFEALAHQDSVTHLRVSVEGRAARVELAIEAIDLNEAIGAPPGIDLTPARALEGAPRAAAYLRARLTLESAGAPCVAGEVSARVTPRRDTWDLVLTAPYACPRAIDDLTLRYGLFFDVDPRHQGMASVRAFGRDTAHVFVARDRALSLSSQRSLRRQLGAYLALGVEHIFHGYDHLAFVLGLLLAAGARPLREATREIAAVVTAFTVAHSLTLGGAALGLVAISPALVEPAIALSIAYVAAENLLVATPRRRWALTFAFGLVHGFGFAGVLAEQGLPARGLAASLLAFNGGVELGQLAVVLLALPVLAFYRAPREGLRRAIPAAMALAAAGLILRAAGTNEGALTAVLGGVAPALGVTAWTRGYAVGVRRVGSAILVALGLFWFFERVTGRVVFGGALG
jgi:hypothetical protein